MMFRIGELVCGKIKKAHMKIAHYLSGAACAGLTFVSIPQALAGGFMLQEQSQLEIGRAFSGGAAAAQDPSTIFYNPAAMTELEGLQITTGATILFIDSAQENLGTSITRPTLTTLPGGTSLVNGGNGGNPFAPVVPVPTSYASYQVGESGLWLGFGLSAPFGLKLRYDSDFFGRYESTYSNLLTLNAQPSIAYKLNDTVSIGGGVDVQYAKVTLKNALPDVNPADPDGELTSKGDDISLGWNIGIFAKLESGVKLGLHYRSQMKHELKGSHRVELGMFDDTAKLRAPLTLPGSVTASISAPLSKNTDLMLTGRYYNWSVLKEIRLQRPGRPDLIKEFHYDDSWSLSAGIDHRVNEKLTVRVGTMFDKTPTNTQFLSTRVPDGDRTWASAGVSFKLNSHMTVNASYAHVFIGSQRMDRTDSYYSPPLETFVTTRARATGNVDMIATSVTSHF